MRKRSIKILSLLLTLVMLIGVLPGMSAWAEDQSESITVTGTTTTGSNFQITGVSYDSDGLYVGGSQDETVTVSSLHGENIKK